MARQSLGVAASRIADATNLSDVSARIPSTSIGTWLVRTTADQTTTSTTAVDTPLMVDLPIGTYAIDGYMMGSTSVASSGPRWALGAATGSTATFGALIGHFDVYTSTTSSTETPFTSGTLVGANPGTVATFFPVKLHAMVVLTSPGVVGIRMASSVNTTTATMRLGSYAIVTALGTQATVAGAAQRVLTKRVITDAYTLVPADAQDVILHVTNAAATTITLPSGISQENTIPWRQWGAGQITFAPGSGMTLVSRGSAFKSAGQYAGGVLTLVDATTWLLEGDLAL